MRWLCGVLAAILVLFAYLQIDDPDPWVWGLIYLLGALWPAIAALSPERFAIRPPVRWGAWLSVAFFAIGFFSLAPTIDSEWIHVEEAREALGYLLCALAGLLAIWTAARVNRPAFAT